MRTVTQLLQGEGGTRSRPAVQDEFKDRVRLRMKMWQGLSAAEAKDCPPTEHTTRVFFRDDGKSLGTIGCKLFADAFK